jgi:single stranded DNA-binding protein
MARGQNVVMLLGHLTNDAQQMGTGNTFACQFSIAVGKRFRGKDGNWAEETAFVYCQQYNAEGQFEYLKQGRQVSIVGRLSSFKMKDSGGKDITKLAVKVDELVLTDMKRNGSEVPRAAEESEVDPAYVEELQQRNATFEEMIRTLEGENAKLLEQVSGINSRLGPRARSAPAPAPAKKGTRK